MLDLVHEKRRLPPELKKDVQFRLKLGANKKKVQIYLQELTGKPVILRDLHNNAQSMSKNRKHDFLEARSHKIERLNTK